MEIPFEYREAVDTYEPIVFEGLKLYPVKVREYEDFLIARSAISFVQQTLPVRYMSMPLLSAFYAVEYDNRQNGKEADGHFARALLFLSLALRLDEGEPTKRRVQDLARRILVAKEDPSMLRGIVVRQDGAEHKITPILFQRMRPILAAQNGIKLESDDANPELLEAERDIAEANGPEMDYSVSSLVTAVATLDRRDEKEIYDWPILKLDRRRHAYERLLGFLIYGFASATGAQFKGGNPVPSPFFDRVETESIALVDMTQVVGNNQINISNEHPEQKE